MTSYSLSWPSTECTKFGPLVVKCPFGFLFFARTLRASRPSESKLYMTHYMTAWTMSLGTFSSCPCRNFAWSGIPEVPRSVHLFCNGLPHIVNCYVLVACENSRPSSLPARMAFRDLLAKRHSVGSEEGRLFSQANFLVTLKDTKMAKPAIE